MNEKTVVLPKFSEDLRHRLSVVADQKGVTVEELVSDIVSSYVRSQKILPVLCHKVIQKSDGEA